jgi:hypothetical protein
MAALGGQLVLFGGSSAAPGLGGSVILGDTWAFDGSSWKQLNPPTAPPPSEYAAMASAGDLLVLFGGLNSGGSYFSTTWAWTGTTWGPAPGDTSVVDLYARFGAGMARLGSAVMMFGGFVDTTDEQVDYDDTWVWSGTGWTLAGEGYLGPDPGVAPSPRDSAAMTTALNSVLLFGGVFAGVDGQSALGDTWTWTQSGWTHVSTPGPSARWGAAITGPLY